MRITGEGRWGPPKDRDAAVAVLKRLPELGVDLVDTADAYGPEDSENLIHEALHPFTGIHVATKGGFTRQGPGMWAAVGRPEYLRQCCLMSMRRLGVETIDLWQLHRVDPKVPRQEQFGLMKELRDEGTVRHLGLSEVSVSEIEAAQEVFEVATVQNLYNLANRQSEDVLEYCEEQGIGFMPYFPLAAGELAAPGGAATEIAAAHEATPGQVALAWLLARSPVMLPIPGTSSVEHLVENVAGADLELTADEVARLSEAAPEGLIAAPPEQKKARSGRAAAQPGHNSPVRRRSPRYPGASAALPGKVASLLRALRLDLIEETRDRTLDSRTNSRARGERYCPLYGGREVLYETLELAHVGDRGTVAGKDQRRPQLG
jgi:aryl-alcohol dehydrogenase-like predicted oxidoreductase